MLQRFPLCQWVPLVRSWRAAQWLWPAAVMLTQQLNTPGTREVEINKFNLSVKRHNLSSAPSGRQTLESITAQLRMSWEGVQQTSLLLWHVSETQVNKWRYIESVTFFVLYIWNVQIWVVWLLPHKYSQSDHQQHKEESTQRQLKHP